MKISYDELIKKINNHEISNVEFGIADYQHYSNCRIEVNKELINNKLIVIIEVKLTNDLSEYESFYNRFDESYKLFNLGRKGSFTLKQIWDKVTIKSINYYQ